MKKALLVILAIVVCVIAGAVYVGHSVYLAIASGLGCFNCVQVNNGGPTIMGSGHFVTENRTVPPFTAIRAVTAFDVVIDRAGTQSVSVTADDNLVSFLTTEVRDGTLYLAAAQGKSFQTKKAAYHVTVTDLRAIESRGSGDIEAQHLDSPSLSVTIAGSGDVKLTGRADDFTLTVRGSGDVDAAGLVVKRAKIVMSGSGDVKVNAADTLDIQMSGSGDLEYRGSAKVTKQSRGSGSVSHKE
jgi:hypothetical protein